MGSLYKRKTNYSSWCGQSEVLIGTEIAGISFIHFICMVWHDLFLLSISLELRPLSTGPKEGSHACKLAYILHRMNLPSVTTRSTIGVWTNRKHNQHFISKSTNIYHIERNLHSNLISQPSLESYAFWSLSYAGYFSFKRYVVAGPRPSGWRRCVLDFL